MCASSISSEDTAGRRKSEITEKTIRFSAVVCATFSKFTFALPVQFRYKMPYECVTFSPLLLFFHLLFYLFLDSCYLMFFDSKIKVIFILCLLFPRHPHSLPTHTWGSWKSLHRFHEHVDPGQALNSFLKVMVLWSSYLYGLKFHGCIPITYTVGI